MGAVLCMNLLAVSGCDRAVQSAVVEEKDETDQKKEENKETVQKTVAEQVEARTASLECRRGKRNS